MLWFGVQGSGRAQKKASSATETQSHEKNGREFHEAAAPQPKRIPPPETLVVRKNRSAGVSPACGPG